MSRSDGHGPPVSRRAKESPHEGQQTLSPSPTKALRLLNKIPPDVHTLFVGISPAVRSARIGHYYGGRSNYFWKLLHHSGLWPVPVAAEDDDTVVSKGFGFTDLARRPAPGSSHLTRADFGDSKRRLRDIVRVSRPKTVVFVGKRAAAVFRGKKEADIHHGLQSWRLENAAVFVVPSTSGASLGHTSYEAKLGFFIRLREFISSYYRVTRKS